MLKCSKLTHDLTEHICQKLLSVETIGTFFHVAVEYENSRLLRECLPVIVGSFREIPFWQNPDFLLTAPCDLICQICEHDNLCLNSELDLVHFLRRYITHH